MNALGFLFRPPWNAAFSFAHTLALLLAIGGACLAAPGRRALAAVVLLASCGWAVNVAVAVRLATLPPGVVPPTALAWTPLVGDLPVWAAIVLGVGAVWRGRSRA